MSDTEDTPTLVGPATDKEIENFLRTHKPSALEQEGTTYTVTYLENANNLFVTNSQLDNAKKDVIDVVEHWRIELYAQALVGKIMNALSTSLLEEVSEEFHDDMHRMARKHKILSGDWSSLHSKESVDRAWKQVVKALANPQGALAKTGRVYQATVTGREKKRNTHLILVSCDEWDSDGMVYKTLVKDCAIVPLFFLTDIFRLYKGLFEEVSPSPFMPVHFMTKSEVTSALKFRRRQIEIEEEAESILANESKPTAWDGEFRVNGEPIEQTNMTVREAQALVNDFSQLIERVEIEIAQLEEEPDEVRPTGEEMRATLQRWLREFVKGDSPTSGSSPPSRKSSTSEETVLGGVSVKSKKNRRRSKANSTESAQETALHVATKSHEVMSNMLKQLQQHFNFQVATKMLSSGPGWYTLKEYEDRVG